ncbi:DoxX family protein [Hymenobacter koreensis]|uniref:DoxX family protein n=1 Tax=Hymenobacter koreensis TaxID=1084523 RepID=A0ABP8IYI4_9BACT
MKKLLFAATPLTNRAADAVWLLFRLHIGLSIADGAGWAKLTNLAAVANAQVPGPPDWFVQQVAGLGFTFPSPYFWAGAAVWGEFVGGLLIALGLFTRWSGLQLAFQFFVVAFLWYENPSPITGMYFQQLLFWGFALVTVLGGGRYSLDYWLTRRAVNAANTASKELRIASDKRPAVVAAALGLLTLVSTLCFAGDNLKSNLLIEPRKQFVLGGEQRGAFKVSAHNIGKVPVEIKERPRGGGIFGKATLAPGQRATLRFMAGSAALLLNPSDERANLLLTVSGDTQLSMGYEQEGKR